MIDFDKAAGLALDAVAKASRFLTDSGDRNVIASKGSARDVVTAADLGAQDIILSALKVGTDFPIVAEEQNNPLQTDDAAPVWYVDPLDGTVNYAHGLPLYAVSVGLRAAGRFAIGAVCLPALGELYFTYGDKTAYLGGRVLAPRPADYAQSLVAVSFAGKKGDSELRRRQYGLFGALNDETRGALRTGSAAVNICYAAAGRVQAALGFAAQLWDVAGALAVARCAGLEIAAAPSAYGSGIDYVVGAPEVVASVQARCASEGVPICR